MDLTILGCSGSIAAPDSPCSGYLLESAGTRIAVELGNGTLGPLQRHVDPFDLDALLLSHLHADHCADVATMTVLRRYHPSPPHDPRSRRLPVYAPEGAAQRLAALYATSASEWGGTDLGDVFDFHPLSELSLRLGAFEVQPVPVHHVCPTWGFRISDGRGLLAYTGDTGPFPGLTALAANGSALLAEASWPHSPDVPEGLHLSGTQAGRLAQAAGVGRLLLTHVQPWMDAERVRDEAAAEYAGPVELVAAGSRYEI